MNLRTQLKEYWMTRDLREQRLLFLGAGVLLVFLIYAFIYTPIETHIETQRQDVLEKQDTLRFIKQVSPQLQAQSRAKPISSTALLSAIQEAFARPPFQAFPSQLSQSNPTDIDIQFQKVPFNVLLNWLWQFSRTYQIQIKSLEAQKTDVSGVCQVHLVLQTGLPK